LRPYVRTFRKHCLVAAMLTAWIVAGMAMPGRGNHSGAAVASGSETATQGQIREGASLFRANCSLCHGLNAHGGGRGPDLTSGRWLHGSTDAAIFRTVSQGLPGTEMPGSNIADSETRAIISYLRSLSPSSKPGVARDRTRGKRIFFGKAACFECHMVSGEGGGLGPDLTRVGASRSESYLIDSIREPNKELSEGMIDPNNPYGNVLVYDSVTVVTRTGERISGVSKNEDTFSVQLLDRNQQLHLLLKKNLESVTHERKSLMPAYTTEILNDADLRDVVTYLESLRGTQ